MAERPLSAREVRVLETNALAHGVSLDTLMENAGRAVAEEAAKLLESGSSRVAIVAGTGRNGGDGAVAAHYLGLWGHRPELFLVGSPAEIRSAVARRAYERAAHHHPARSGVPSPNDLAGASLIIDALLGIGQVGPLRAPYLEAAAAMAASGVPILSVDVPSGLGSEGAVLPASTVTFSALKLGMRSENSGGIVLREVGLPPAAWSETGPGEFHLYPSSDSARTLRLLVVGGGPFAGAPALTALAAMRSGAERATIIAPRPAASLAQAFSPNLVVIPLGDDRFTGEEVEPVLRLVAELRPAAVAIGMGAGREPATREFFGDLIGRMEGRVPLLVDADALDGVLGPEVPPRQGTILATPNEGELHRLFAELPGAEGEREAFLESRAAHHRLTLLAKGNPDRIVGPEGSRVNRHHHPSATVSGVGDLLSGVAAFLLGAGLTPFEVGRLASYWVGEAGIRVEETHGQGMVATDVLEELPRALVAGLRAARESVG